MGSPLVVIVAFQVLFGLGFVAVAAKLAHTNVRLMLLRGRAIGRIVSLRLPDVSGLAFAEVAFLTPTGEEVRAVSPVPSDTALGRIGDFVPVRYRPRDPRQIVVGDQLSAGVLTAVWVLGLGTILELLSLLLALLMLSGTG
jgi:Protein of unknown function (DUF3592)